MVTAFDVAAFILRESRGCLEALALQKLIYYAQGWSLAWEGRPLFRDRIEAWTYGPVVRSLWETHRNQPYVMNVPRGNPDALDDAAKATVRSVLAFYGAKSPGWLVDLSHRERPWRDARGPIHPDAKSDAEITPEAMAAYFSSIGVAPHQLDDALMRGLEVVVSTPLYELHDLLSEETFDGEGLEQWLESGTGSPWGTS